MGEGASRGDQHAPGELRAPRRSVERAKPRGARRSAAASGGERHDRAERRMSVWPEGRGKWSVWRFHWLIHHKIIRALERARPYLRGVLLDVGCGTKPFAPVFEAGLSRYWGVDL